MHTHMNKCCCEGAAGLEKVAFWFAVSSSELERAEFLLAPAGLSRGALSEGQLLFCLITDLR